MFLDVLIFILWLLLCIIGFTLLIVLIVLFVPVVYKVYAVNNPDALVKCRVSWLFGGIKALFDYDKAEDKTDFVLKIFGITLGKKKHPQEYKPDRHKGKPSKTETNATSYPEKIPESVTRTSEPELKIPEKKADESLNEKAEKKDDKKSEPKAKNKEKKTGFFKRLKEKVKEIKEINKRFKAIPNKKEIFSALLKLLKQLYAVFKPKKFEAKIEFGLDEPATTAELLGAIEVIKAFTGIKIETIADYNNKVFRYKINAQGGFMVFQLIIPLVKFAITPPVLHVIRNYKSM